MQQNQQVQTEQNFQNFQTSTQSDYEHIPPKYTKKIQQYNQMRQRIFTSLKNHKFQNINFHHRVFTDTNINNYIPINPKKLISSPIEGRALLNNLRFPKTTKMIANMIDLNQNNQKENLSLTRRRLFHKLDPQFYRSQQNLELDNMRYKTNLINIEKTQKSLIRNRQISLELNQPKSPCCIWINGIQTVLSSRDSSPNKKY